MDKKNYKKVEYVEAIESHLRKQGKKLTNLRKATINELKELITKYNVDMVDFVSIRNKEMKEKEEQEKEEQKIRDLEYDERKKTIEENRKRYMIVKLNDYINLEMVKNKWVVIEQLKDTIIYNNDKDKYDKAKKQNALFANKLNNHLGLNCCVNGNELNVNGLIIHINSLDGYDIRSKEHLTRMYNEESFIGYLDKIGFIKTFNNYSITQSINYYIFTKALTKALKQTNNDFENLSLVINHLKDIIPNYNENMNM